MNEGWKTAHGVARLEPATFSSVGLEATFYTTGRRDVLYAP